MEATGVYWKPVYYLLEDDFELLAGQCPARQERARPQDRRPGRPVALPAARARARAGELRAAEADPRAARPDPLPQVAHLGAPARGQPAAEGARGRQHQAGLGRDQTCSAPRAGRCSRSCARETTTPRRWPSSPRASCAPSCRRCGRRSRAASRAHHALLVSHLLAHIDYLDETIDSLSAEIEERLRPFERQLELLETIPGVGRLHRRGDPGRVRARHEPLPQPPPRRELGGDLPRPRRVGRQAPLGQDAQGQPLAAHGPDRGRQQRRRVAPGTPISTPNTCA